MVVARQAGLGHVREHPAHHGAQGLLGEKIVADVIDRHEPAAVPSGLMTSQAPETFRAAP
ncbi:hypothetical protein XFLAVUS301_23530 [Xanthobacter flavus]|uniref:Uncharacterized protein n=1 Tax=Xanthobacter flavus TaxID=281 RepID=A0A9W6FJG2_XANFL|nr:hypothetical protein XFLAVUS301_23530 [Xanthobacter flavus]